MRYFILVLIVVSLFSCRKDLMEEAEMVGKWECVEIVSQVEQPTLKSILFDFKADSTYQMSHGKTLRKGTWYTLEDRLYTTPEGGVLMAVKLGRSGNDTLRFHQNRGGMVEVWTMVRRGNNTTNSNKNPASNPATDMDSPVIEMDSLGD